METLREKRIRAGKLGGRKPGQMLQKTIDRNRSLEAVRQRIFKIADKLVTAQSVPALGYYELVRPYVGADGLNHTEIIRDPKRIQFLLNTGVQGKDYYIVVGSEPDHKAASALLDRAYGRPTESHEHSGRDGKPLIIILDE